MTLGEQHLTLQGDTQGDLHRTLQGEKHLTGLHGKHVHGQQWHILQQIQLLRWQTGQHKQGYEWHL